MENLIPALILIAVGALMIWLGLRNRKGAIKAYEDDKQRYTGTATMTVVDLREEDVERWEDQEDGTSRLARYTIHLPTYEYTVDGKTYTYSSRQDWGSNKGVGRQVTGYYDPTKKKIQQINKEGIPYVLVSARMPKGMTNIRAELGAKSPMICYSGALVVDEDDKPIYSVALPKESAKKLCKRIQELDSKISISIYTNDEWLVEDKTEYWAAQETDITGVIPEEVSFEDEEVYQEVHKILCMGDKEDIAKLEQQLVEEFPEIRIYRSKDTYLEIMSMKQAAGR